MLRPIAIAIASLALCLLTCLSGCDPMVRAEAQAKAYCAKEGLEPFIFDRERTENIWTGPTATLKLHCIDPHDIVHTSDAFGVDLYASRNTNGAMILRVTPGSIGAKAGLTAEDVVYEYAGQRIGNVGDLQTSIAATTPGQEAIIKVRRGKQDVTVTAQF